MKKERGFTLIELMIVVAIIGILAAIAIPRFAELIRKSNEGSTKGNLGAVRSALSIYYGDNEGVYPADDLTSLTTNQKYIVSIPTANVATGGHSASTTVTNQAGNTVTDNGGWGYNSGAADANWGSFWVNCSHTDSKNNRWTTY